jgi:hypothetical protein
MKANPEAPVIFSLKIRRRKPLPGHGIQGRILPDKFTLRDPGWQIII